MSAFIKDGKLQGAALMNRELAGKSEFSVAPLSIPKNSGSANNQKSGDDFPYDYYTGTVEITYPDKNKDRAFYLPDVVIYNSYRSTGNTIRYPFGFSRGFIAYFEPALKRAYDHTIFGDRRYSHTPDTVWTESRIYPVDQNSKQNSNSSLEVEVYDSESGKSFKFKDLGDYFQRFNVVALKANITCTIKLQAQVTKGQQLPDNAEARPVFTPSKISIRSNIDIAEPVVLSGRKAESSEVDSADSNLIAMLEQMNAEDEDEEEEDEDEEDEEEAD